MFAATSPSSTTSWPLTSALHKFITICALITGASQFIFLFNLIYSRFKGATAPDNPWNATSLEWGIPSPPPWNNFGGRHPVVYHDPFQYGVNGSKGDFIMQDSPEAAGGD